MNAAVYSVSEINNRIKNLLDSDPILGRVYVRGELSNYKVYPSGHHYFTLKDKDASLRCVLFRGDAARLRFRPENGMGVTCMGRISVFPRDGAYQMYVTQLSPEGIGDLYLAYEQLKSRLLEEGLFDREHKKAIPPMPERIAVITSGAGAAVRDVIRVLGERWPMAKVIVLPVRVQGVEAPPEIVGAIRYANRHKIADLIITGRGGGSMEDLWAFNDERLARAIFESEIPVISAVGHEPDVTIADFVADLRAATPSNGAELAVPDENEIREQLHSISARMDQTIRRKLDIRRNKILDLAARPVLASPRGYIQQRRVELDRLADSLFSAQDQIIAKKKQRYVRLAASLDAMSPLKVLARGFSVTTKEDGTVMTDSSLVERGERVQVTLSNGKLMCRVEDKTEV